MLKKRYLELVYHRSVATLKSEADRSYLGFAWWLLDPILYLAVFYIVFGKVLQRGGDGFIAFLLCGLIFWRWFDNTVRQSGNSIRIANGIVSQVYVPKLLLPVSVILTNTIKFGLVLLVFVAFVLLSGYPLTQYWLYLPLIILVQLFLIVGVSWTLAALVPFVPDLTHVIGYGMTLLFFLSGIFFDINEVADPMRSWLSLNPMVTLIDAYRAVMLRGELPNWGSFYYVLSLAGVLTVLGGTLLHRFDRHYPRLIG